MSQTDVPTIEIPTHRSPINATIRPPGSKSVTNRALACAALADGTSVLTGALDSDDTRVMTACLRQLGVQVEADYDADTLTVHGTGGKFLPRPAELFVGNSGTTVRFLTAMLGMAGGKFTLDGVARMRERPIGPLVDTLSMLGASVVATSPNQCPPVEIDSLKIHGGNVGIKGNLSSQYLSGLLMAAPQSDRDISLTIVGPLISKPYVHMTVEVMKSFGVNVVVDDGLTLFRIGGGENYSPTIYSIEPDASAASYFFAAAAICGGTATVEGLSKTSLQGDVHFVDCLEQMGCEVHWNEDSISVTGPARHGIDVDMAHISDTVQTITSVALFVEGPTHIRNVAHNRVKETDRIGNLAVELRKFGARVEEREDGLSIFPGPLNGATIETYDDHRMAMGLSLVGLRQDGVVIEHPQCVGKTYPNYFEAMRDFLTQ